MRRAVVMAVLCMVLIACDGDTVIQPEWAEGMPGRTVLDESGLLADWEYVGYPDESDAFLNRTGRYTGDFGVDATTPGSTDVVVTWGALPCQQSPVARINASGETIHVDIYAGPNPNEGCAAMEVRYGLRLTLNEPLGTRTVTASLADSVSQKEHSYP